MKNSTGRYMVSREGGDGCLGSRLLGIIRVDGASTASRQLGINRIDGASGENRTTFLGRCDFDQTARKQDGCASGSATTVCMWCNVVAERGCKQVERECDPIV